MLVAVGTEAEGKQLGGQVPVAAGIEVEERQREVQMSAAAGIEVEGKQLGGQVPVAAGIEVEERQREVQSSGMFASRTRWETVP
jgi:hypothetical protein